MAARFIWTLASVLLAAGPTIAAGTVDLEFPPVAAPAPPAAPSEVTRSFWANPRSRTAPLDVSFHRLDVVSALRFLTGEQTNVVAADDALDRPVTMSLRSVNPGEALDHLLSSLDLGARVEGNTVFLEKSESRTFRIPLVLQAESQVWEELQQGVSSLAGDNALVALNQSGGVLTVADRPSALDRLEDHLDRVVISLLQQIEIEVEILEASYQVDQGAGVDWTLFNGILDPDLGVSGALSGAFAASTPTDPREVFQVGLVKADKWRTVLDAFEDDVRVDLVSRPRMTVMSNQPALFALRERIPYLQKTVSQEGGVTRTDFEIVFDEAGVELSVVASVTEGGEIQMEVHPKISAVTGFTPILPDLGSQPVIDLRETKSLVRLAEGQATVLSGMLQDRERKNATGIPVLMHVPVLGRLFRHETTSSEKTEIIIVLTPRFRKEPAVRSLERYDSI
ncbi:MAG: hypothetical protein KC591_17850, partial [Gemmatimonadetes bacterium]|nr:hypothetical protein [Gemmatimonadota bacterium]